MSRSFIKFVRGHLKQLRDMFSHKVTFEELSALDKIYLYAGDVPKDGHYTKFIGMSLSQSNAQHIRFDVTDALPLKDACVDIYHSEHVFEHIAPADLPGIIDEIHRVLKPGGVFRLTLPDYQFDLVRDRTQKDKDGKFIFDPGGGGDYVDGKVVNGGHLWFPDFVQVKQILEKTMFKDITFFHYYDEEGNPVTDPIDYSISYVKRTPDHDPRAADPYRPMSIVVDCIK